MIILQNQDYLTSGKPASLLGFGCAPIMGRVSRRQALRALAMAYELGVRHFDIARSYGFGDAEDVLGEFLAQGRRSATVTSKFGVAPPALKTWQRMARPVVRLARNRLGALRGAVRANSGALLAARNYDVAYARQCLETSLRKLRRDRIDFYLVHEPQPDALGQIDALSRFLDDAVAIGKIGRWGIAHPLEGALPAHAPTGSVIQMSSNLDAGTMVDYGHPVRFITQPFGGQGSDISSKLLTRVSGQLGCSTPTAALMLAAHQVGPVGAVIAGMFSEQNIRMNCRVIADYRQDKPRIDSIIGETVRTLNIAEALER